MSHPQGTTTEWKEEGFRGFFRQNIGATKGPNVYRFPYHHICMHAGSGRNATCLGSPLVLCEEAVAAQRLLKGYFCECNAAWAAELRGHLVALDLPAYVDAEVLLGDHILSLEKIADRIRGSEKPEFALGDILFDPAGMKDMPFEKGQEFCQEFPRIDICWHCNFSLMASARGCKRKAAVSPQFSGFAKWPALDYLIEGFNRRYWWVRNPLNPAGGDGGHRFSTLIGRNRDIAQAPATGFFRIDSEEGQGIVHQLKRIAVGQKLMFPLW